MSVGWAGGGADRVMPGQLHYLPTWEIFLEMLHLKATQTEASFQVPADCGRNCSSLTAAAKQEGSTPTLINMGVFFTCCGSRIFHHVRSLSCDSLIKLRVITCRFPVHGVRCVTLRGNLQMALKPLASLSLNLCVCCKRSVEDVPCPEAIFS